MKISTKGIYALEAMIELASRNTACVSIRDIADARNCSVKYLEQPVWMGMQEQIYKVLESKTLKYLTDIYRNEVSA